MLPQIWTDEQISKAVDKQVENMDIKELKALVFVDMRIFWIDNADPEQLQEFMEEYSDQNN